MSKSTFLETENLQEKFEEVVNSPEWQEFQEKFNNCDDIYVLGQRTTRPSISLDFQVAVRTQCVHLVHALQHLISTIQTSINGWSVGFPLVAQLELRNK